MKTMPSRLVLRALVSVLLLTLVLTASGCSLFNKQEDLIPAPTQDEKTLDKRTGTVQIQLDGQTKKTQYVLHTESGEDITLVSVGVNLDQYVGRKVEVSGLYEPRDNSLEVEDATTLSEELETKKEYMNGKMGVSFQFPANWTIDEGALANGEASLYVYPYNVPVADRGSIDRVTILRLDNPTRLSPKDWLKLDEFYRPTVGSAGEYSYQQSLIGKKQYDAVKTVTALQNQVVFWVQRDTFMYQVAFDSRQPKEKNMNENAFFELVASFDFVPITDTTAGIVSSGQVLPSPEGLPKLLPSTTTSGDQGKYGDAGFLTEYVKAAGIANGGLQSLDSTISNDGTWSVTSYDFVVKDENSSPVGVYVVYKSSSEQRRVYATYKNSDDPASLVKQADFTLNSSGAWILKSGTDTGKGMMKVHVDAGTSETYVVKAGMQLIVAPRMIKASFQVPSKWYWGITPEGYAFDSQPLSTREPLAVLLDESKYPADGKEAHSAAGMQYKTGTDVDGSHQLYCTTKESVDYCVRFSDAALSDVVVSILESIKGLAK